MAFEKRIGILEGEGGDGKTIFGNVMPYYIYIPLGDDFVLTLLKPSFCFDVLGPGKIPNIGFSAIDVVLGGTGGALLPNSKHGFAKLKSNFENSVDGLGKSSFGFSSTCLGGVLINCLGLSGNANGTSIVRLPFSFVYEFLARAKSVLDDLHSFSLTISGGGGGGAAETWRWSSDSNAQVEVTD